MSNSVSPLIKSISFLIFTIVLGTVLAFGLRLVESSGLIGRLFVERSGLVGTINTLNPLFTSQGTIEEAFSQQMFRGLFTYDENSRIIGDIAESWEIQEDGKVYIVTLKSDARWSDNRLVTVADVLFTFEVVQHEQYVGWARDYFNGVSLEVQDESTIVFRLESEYSPFLDSLQLPILPSHVFGGVNVQEVALETFKQNGPYSGDVINVTFRDSTINGKVVNGFTVRTKDESRRTDWYLFESQQEIEQAFDSGAIDRFVILRNNIGDRYIADASVVTKNVYFAGEYSMLILNTNAIEDQSVRAGIIHAVDTTRLSGTPAVGPYPQQSPFYASLDGSRLAYDQEQAVDLIGDRSFFLTTIDAPHLVSLAKQIKDQFREIGIPVLIKVVDIQSLYGVTLQDRDFEMLLLPQSIGQEPDLYSFWHSSQIEWPGLNLSSLQERRVDRSLELGRVNANFDERVQIYSEFQEHFLAEHVAVFLTHTEAHTVERVSSQNTRNVDWYWGLGGFINSEI